MGMNKEPIERAAMIVGSKRKLGAHLGITGQAIAQWRRCPAEHAPLIERATGGQVTCHDLRPDLWPAPAPTPATAPAE